MNTTCMQMSRVSTPLASTFVSSKSFLTYVIFGQGGRGSFSVNPGGHFNPGGGGPLHV